MALGGKHVDIFHRVFFCKGLCYEIVIISKMESIRIILLEFNVKNTKRI
jgi:hypothetical protein